MTYFTFSRALHLMKNSGAKVKRSSEDWYMFIKDNKLFYSTQQWGVEQAERLEILTADDILANDWEIYNEN